MVQQIKRLRRDKLPPTNRQRRLPTWSHSLIWNRHGSANWDLPFLQQVKQMALEVIEEIGQKHGTPALAQLRQTLVETVGAVLKREEGSLLAQLKPAMVEGGDAVRQKTDSLLGDLKQFITTTVVEVFRVHVPEYSRWAGQRVLDHILAATLFCLAAVLVCVGGILGLERAGLPQYAVYLIGGSVALVAGLAFLKLRSRRWERTGPADDIRRKRVTAVREP